jgi:hypothetical protein
MHATSRKGSRPGIKSLQRHRRGVIVCLLALFIAMFGHIEVPLASDMAVWHIDGMADAGELPSDRHDTASHQQCPQHIQCSMQAVLPVGAAVSPNGSNAAEAVPEQVSGNRTISPLRRPPKTEDVL